MQLLQLLVLTNVPPHLVPASAAPLFDDLKKSPGFAVRKYSVTVAVQAEPASTGRSRLCCCLLVYNLADNACRRSPAGETVTISAAGRRMAIGSPSSIMGGAFSRSIWDKITEPFIWRINPAPGGRAAPGLGWPCANGIADLHGTPCLTFDSQGGQGPTVTLCLSVVGEAKRKGRRCMKLSNTACPVW